MTASTLDSKLALGIRANLPQFALQLVQVSFVGLTLGMVRTVVPALAENEFNLPHRAVGLLVTFVIAFGVVKAIMNFVAGRLSESLGRKRVLVIGWIIALPIPFMIRFGPTWGWIVAATVLLGINQGLTWSMALTSKLDLTRPDQRGLANGLNEFCGYFAVAVASYATAYLANRLGARLGLFVFGLSVILPALLLAMIVVRDTRPWAEMEEQTAPSPSKGEGRGEGGAQNEAATPDPHPNPLPGRERGSPSAPLTTASVVKLTWRNRTFFAICQAGLVEKFTDALMWLFVPALLHQRGVDLVRIGWISSAYTAAWGFSQLFTGPLSDRIGRKRPIAAGMFICAAGVAMMLSADEFAWWIGCAAVTGFGMALLYPNLGAAISDIAAPTWRGSALGIYRFWRDLGLAIGAAGLAICARFTGMLETGFWFVAICMMVSGSVLWFLARETHVSEPRP